MAAILLVDDDPLQASWLLSLLRRRFSDLFRVTDATEALCLIEQREFARNLALVIIGDHTTGFGGADFVSELLTRMPHLRVLILSAADGSSADYPRTQTVFLEKPFVAENMLNVTSEILSTTRNAVA
jgi:DNA-binding NtrC family response regulator